MEPCEADLCRFCSQLIPLREEAHTTRSHQSNVADFLQFAGNCPICRVVRNNWSFDLPVSSQTGNAAPANEDSSMSNPFTISLRDVQHHGTGVSHALLRVESKNSQNNRAFLDEFFITTCEVDCIQPYVSFTCRFSNP